MNSTILFVLMLFTFLAVMIAAFIDLLNTRRAIALGESSSAIDPTRGPRAEGFNMTTPN